MTQTLQLRTDSAAWALSCAESTLRNGLLLQHQLIVRLLVALVTLGSFHLGAPDNLSTGKVHLEGCLARAMRGEEKPKRHSRVLIFHQSKTQTASSSTRRSLQEIWLTLVLVIYLCQMEYPSNWYRKGWKGLRMQNNAKREVSLLRFLSFAHCHVCHISADLSIDLLGWCSDSNVWWIGKGPHGFSRDLQAMNIINSINSYKINQLSLLLRHDFAMTTSCTKKSRWRLFVEITWLLEWPTVCSASGGWHPSPVGVLVKQLDAAWQEKCDE